MTNLVILETTQDPLYRIDVWIAVLTNLVISWSNSTYNYYGNFPKIRDCVKNPHFSDSLSERPWRLPWSTCSRRPLRRHCGGSTCKRIDSNFWHVQDKAVDYTCEKVGRRWWSRSGALDTSSRIPRFRVPSSDILVRMLAHNGLALFFGGFFPVYLCQAKWPRRIFLIFFGKVRKWCIHPALAHTFLEHGAR
jgi:hypothetical protein